MPELICGADRCALGTGTHTIGGRGSDALPLPALEWHSAVAVLTIAASGDEPATIRRLTASVVVRLDGVPLGIAAAPVTDGAAIEFEGCRLEFVAAGALPSAAADGERGFLDPRPANGPRLVSSTTARLVNVKSNASFPLTDHRIVIGRDESCDLVLEGKGTSRRHASVSPSPGGWVLRDQSANGMKVNGTPMAGTRVLAHGDVLQILDDELRFEVEGEEPMGIDAPADGATQILDLSRIERIARGVGSGRRMSCSLEIVNRAGYGTVFELDKPVCAIGRGTHNDVVLRDDSVSGTHATLLRKGGAWCVLDLDSVNGTYVDGSRTSGERVIANGSRLRTGGVEMVFRSFADGLPEGEAAPVTGGLWRRVVSLLAG